MSSSADYWTGEQPVSSLDDAPVSADELDYGDDWTWEGVLADVYLLPRAWVVDTLTDVGDWLLGTDTPPVAERVSALSDGPELGASASAAASDAAASLPDLPDLPDLPALADLVPEVRIDWTAVVAVAVLGLGALVLADQFLLRGTLAAAAIDRAVRR